MIREILEQNGIVFTPTQEVVLLNGICDDNGINYDCSRKGFLDNLIGEIFAIDYIKENGFKLEWFNDFDEYIDNHIEDTIQRLCATLSDDDDKTILKLLCRLYANDIEITND